LATAIPAKSRPTLADWATNDRIRREGTQILVEAALRNKCRLYLQQSVTYLYGDRRGAWVEEQTPVDPSPGGVLQSAFDMEQIVLDAIQRRDLPAIILRLGMFYCYDSGQTRTLFDLTRQGFFPIIGDGAAYWNSLNVDDAAEAVFQAILNYPNGLRQTFNVCDDEPATFQDVINYLAELLGAKKPRHIPVFLAKLFIGPVLVNILLASVRCRNQAIKETLGWQPRYSTYREGYQAEVEKWKERAPKSS
jgi:2-alkyl-3-oxoalkanoate reductase